MMLSKFVRFLPPSFVNRQKFNDVETKQCVNARRTRMPLPELTESISTEHILTVRGSIRFITRDRHGGRRWRRMKGWKDMAKLKSIFVATDSAEEVRMKPKLFGVGQTNNVVVWFIVQRNESDWRSSCHIESFTWRYDEAMMRCTTSLLIYLLLERRSSGLSMDETSVRNVLMNTSCRGIEYYHVLRPIYLNRLYDLDHSEWSWDRINTIVTLNLSLRFGCNHIGRDCIPNRDFLKRCEWGHLHAPQRNMVFRFDLGIYAILYTKQTRVTTRELCVV